MKKLFKILVILLFSFVVCPITSFASNIDKIKMDILILPNGDAKITEYWDANPSQGTEVYKPYYNLGNSQIKEFKVSENNQEYVQLDKWDTSKSIKEKKYKSGINYISNGLELCWGIGSYGEHTYKLEYTLTMFAKGYEDADLVYFTLITKDFTPLPDNVEITISGSESFPSETLVWGYGWPDGVADIQDGKVYLNAPDGLDSGQYITVLIKFPLGTFNTADKIEETFEEVFWRAEEGVELPDYGEYDYGIDIDIFSILKAIVGLSPLIIMIALGVFIFSGKRNSLSFEQKTLKKKKELHYFRDIPCKKSLFRAYWMGYNYKFIKEKANLLGSILLKWIQKDYITVTKDTKGIFKKETTIIDMTKDFQCDDELELSLKTMLLKAAGKNKMLEEKEFENWSKDNYSTVDSWFEKVLENQTLKFIEEGLIVEEQVTKLKIFKRKKRIVTIKANEEAEQLLGLKKYLKEFSLINQRKSIEVKLWNEYLIFAQLLGIADEVAKEFEKVYPDYFKDMNLHYSYTDLYFINRISHASIRGANAGHQAHINRMHSGGGGSSFSGGGGGSFGGGGSGGGFR